MAYPDLVIVPAPAPTIRLPDPVTVQEVKEAKYEQALAPIKGLGVALSAVPVALAAPPVAGGAARFVNTYIFSGAHFSVEPLTGKSFAPKISPLAGATYLAPAPAGVVPPELFQLSPSWIRDIVGVDFPGQKTVGAKASDVRVKVFQSEEAERKIIALVLRDYTYPGTPRNLHFLNTGDLIQIDFFLRATTPTQARTPAASAAVEAELAKRPIPTGPILAAPPAIVLRTEFSGAVGGLLSPYSVVSDVTFNPNIIRPVRAVAEASRNNGQILNRELVTELADP